LFEENKEGLIDETPFDETLNQLAKEEAEEEPF
jgi:hypothetical protein